MSTETRVARGERARRLLTDELLVDAFVQMREAIVQRIEDTPLRDAEGVLQLRMMLRLLKDLRVNLERVVNDGKIAAAEIEMSRDPSRVSQFLDRFTTGT